MLEKNRQYIEKKGVESDPPPIKKDHNRVQSLLKDIRCAPLAVCCERALLLTDYYKRHSKHFSSPQLRRAKSLTYILENKSTHIYPGELIVGNFTSKRVGAQFFPEMVGLIMVSDYFNPFLAAKMPLEFPIADRLRVLRHIFPFWALRNVLVKAFIPNGKNPLKWIKSIKDLLAYSIGQLVPKTHFLNEIGGIIHLIPDYEGVLKKGLRGYLQDIENARTNAVTAKQQEFLHSLEIVALGVIKMAVNFSNEAKKLADQEKNGSQRQKELLEIARICKKVPYHPPETVHEALQAILFLHITFAQETLDMSISFGRMDQYLYPIYRHEIQAYAKKNNISKEDAKIRIKPHVQELLACFFLKTNEVLPLYNDLVSKAHEGLPSFYAVTIGGQTKDGQDGQNDITDIFMEVIKHIPLRQPNYHARYSEKSRPEFLENIVDVIEKTGFTPALINDEAILPVLQKHLETSNHISPDKALEEARNYGTIGCVEMGIPGKSYPMADAAFFNLPICLVDALLKKEYYKLNDLSGIKKAFQKEIQNRVKTMIHELRRIEQTRKNHFPLPFTSLMVKGCVEKLLDVTAGGAIYNWSSIQTIGLADTVDSFFALEHAFAHGIPIATIRDAVQNNFRNQDDLYQTLMRAAKYGQDDLRVDKYLDFVLNCYTSALKMAGKNIRNGTYITGGFSSGAHQLFGKQTKALPSGRKKGVRFANGVSPTDTTDSHAITSTMNSVSRIDPNHYINGYTFNQKVDPVLMENPKLFAGLLRGFFKQNKKGVQIQFNVIKEEILRAAQANPEEYPWLVVRVSGYSAYFKDLSPQMQSEIIERALKK